MAGELARLWPRRRRRPSSPRSTSAGGAWRSTGPTPSTSGCTRSTCAWATNGLRCLRTCSRRAAPERAAGQGAFVEYPRVLVSASPSATGDALLAQEAEAGLHFEWMPKCPECGAWNSPRLDRINPPIYTACSAGAGRPPPTPVSPGVDLHRLRRRVGTGGRNAATSPLTGSSSSTGNCARLPHTVEGDPTGVRVPRVSCWPTLAATPSSWRRSLCYRPRPDRCWR